MHKTATNNRVVRRMKQEFDSESKRVPICSLPIKALRGGDHEKSYRIVELFILITGLNICNLGLVSGWSRVVDPARASRGAKTDYDDRALEFLSNKLLSWCVSKAD